MSELRPGENPLNIEGELSIRNLDELHQLFAGAIGQDADLIIDFAGVEACDTAALQLIISLRKTAAQRPHMFRIATLSPAIERAAAALGIPLDQLAGAPEDNSDNVRPASGGAGGGI